MVAVYEVFAAAIRMRNNAATHIHASALVTRAATVIRNDLENGLISGGVLAGTLQGDSNGSDSDSSTFPGYLKLTTTGGKDPISSINATGGQLTSGTGNLMYGDVQQVEYYIVRRYANGGGAAPQNSGDLVRVVTRDLLDGGQTAVQQQQILTGVQSCQGWF